VKNHHPLDVALALVIVLGAHLLGLLIDLTAPATAPATATATAPAPKPAITAVVTHQPLTVAALVERHTQRELMVMAGTKSKRSKKHLAEKILKIKN
jgi:hypothetical protein